MEDLQCPKLKQIKQTNKKINDVKKGQLFSFLTNNGMDRNTFHYKVSVIVLYLNERDSFEWRD